MVQFISEDLGQNSAEDYMIHWLFSAKSSPRANEANAEEHEERWGACDFLCTMSFRVKIASRHHLLPEKRVTPNGEFSFAAVAAPLSPL